MGNTPIKTNDCYVMYSDWMNAKPNDTIKVLVEGEISMMPRNQVKVFEDPNDFANPEHYVEGVVIEEIVKNNEDGGEPIRTERAAKNVLINAIDYTQAVGDASPVRVLNPITKSIETYPKSLLRTLSV